MIKDTLRLSPPPDLFLEKSLDDLAFVNTVLETLVRSFADEGGKYNGSGESEYISDTEWQFTQLLTEFALESSPFSVHAFPEIMSKITVLRDLSNARRRTIEGAGVPAEIAQAEPVVTSAELSSLLGGI